MRLAQLARKISVNPAEIVRFLQAKNEILADVNTRLTEEQLKLILLRFAPNRVIEILAEENNALIEPEPEPVGVNELTIEGHQEELRAEEVTAPQIPQSTADEVQPAPLSAKIPEDTKQAIEPEEEKDPFEGVDVIKAPKVTLTGLKVIGKIDLPEPKKKEPEIPPTSTEPKEETSNPEHLNPLSPPLAKKTDRRNNKYADRRERVERPRKNPIAIQREREAREAEERRKEELKKEKERRTQFYNSRIKQSAPKRPVRLVDEPLEGLHEIKEEPKTFLGKIWRWLTT